MIEIAVAAIAGTFELYRKIFTLLVDGPQFRKTEAMILVRSADLRCDDEVDRPGRILGNRSNQGRQVTRRWKWPQLEGCLQVPEVKVSVLFVPIPAISYDNCSWRCFFRSIHRPMVIVVFGCRMGAFDDPFVLSGVIHAWVAKQLRCFAEVKKECDLIIRVSNTESRVLDMANIESDQETQRN
jgi:hypothetical protein